MKYKIEIWRYHSKVDEYESDELFDVKYWFDNNWLYAYENCECGFSVKENGENMASNEYNLHFNDELHEAPKEYQEYVEQRRKKEIEKANQERLDNVLSKFDEESSYDGSNRITSCGFNLYLFDDVHIDYYNGIFKLYNSNSNENIVISLDTVESLIKDLEE